jgi:hypothetical protein
MEKAVNHQEREAYGRQHAPEDGDEASQPTRRGRQPKLDGE